MEMLQDIEQFDTDVENLLQDREQVNQRFQVVKPRKAVQARLYKEGKNKERDFEDPNMNEIYDFTTVNCDNRPDIKKLVARTEEMQARMLEFADNYKALKEKCGQKPKTVPGDYVPDKKDDVDIMFAAALKRSNYRGQIKIIKLGPGKYMFGTKKIMAKIINGKLVIRVGGGYMNADEFIEQYGRMEVIKALAEEERKNGVKFADENEVMCEEGHFGETGAHTHKAATRSSLAGTGPRKSVKNTIKKAELHIAQENVKHHIEDTLFAKFSGADAGSKRSNLLNAELANMKVGGEISIAPSGMEGRRTVNNLISPNQARASLHARIHGSPRGVTMADGSPKSGGLRKLGSPTAGAGPAKRNMITSPSNMSARRSPK